MNIYKYTIQLSKNWDRQINHNVETHLIQKNSKEFLVKSCGSGKLMTIISNKDLNDLNVIKDLGFQLRIKIINKEEILLKKYTSVKITGNVSYSFESTIDGKNYCPIDIKTGKIIYKEKLDLFLKNNLGVDVLSLKILPIGKEIVSGKIIIYDQFYIEVIGTVSDQVVFEKLQVCSIGKKKSYGLGYMQVESYENSL